MTKPKATWVCKTPRFTLKEGLQYDPWFSVKILRSDSCSAKELIIDTLKGMNADPKKFRIVPVRLPR